MSRAYLKDSRGLRAFMVERAIFERVDLTAHEKLVLCYLAMRANSESECWPSYNTIAGDCSISRRQAMRVVAALEDKGLLAKSNRSNDLGRFTSNLFRLFSAEDPVFPPSQIPSGFDGDSESPSPELPLHGDSTTPPGDSTTPTPVTRSHLYEQDQLEGESGNDGPGLPPSTLEPTLGSSTVDSSGSTHSQLLFIARHPARPAAVASDDSSSPRTTRSESDRQVVAETAAAFMLRAADNQLERRHLREAEILPALESAQVEHRQLLDDLGYDVSGLVCGTCAGAGTIERPRGTSQPCPACSGQPALF